MNSRSINRNEYVRMVCIRRRKQVRRNYRILFLSCLLIAFILIVSGTSFTFAKSRTDSDARVKRFKSVVISSGDTLTSISGEYYSDEWSDMSCYMHEVEVINHLDEDDVLIAGNWLTVPYYTEVSSL
ncbi:MAG: hypothetical protein K6F34_11405 [Lachnospiraceae bacterium]|nr:hypothetical protein [Lachnospiraceae bacterium]